MEEKKLDINTIIACLLILDSYFMFWQNPANTEELGSAEKRNKKNR